MSFRELCSLHFCTIFFEQMFGLLELFFTAKPEILNNIAIDSHQAISF